MSKTHELMQESLSMAERSLKRAGLDEKDYAEAMGLLLEAKTLVQLSAADTTEAHDTATCHCERAIDAATELREFVTQRMRHGKPE